MSKNKILSGSKVELERGATVMVSQCRDRVSPLKPEVQWFSHPDGYWVLRNPDDLTFLQVI